MGAYQGKHSLTGCLITTSSAESGQDCFRHVGSGSIWILKPTFTHLGSRENRHGCFRPTVRMRVGRRAGSLRRQAREGGQGAEEAEITEARAIKLEAPARPSEQRRRVLSARNQAPQAECRASSPKGLRSLQPQPMPGRRGEVPPPSLRLRRTSCIAP